MIRPDVAKVHPPVILKTPWEEPHPHYFKVRRGMPSVVPNLTRSQLSRWGFIHARGLVRWFIAVLLIALPIRWPISSQLIWYINLALKWLSNSTKRGYVKYLAGRGYELALFDWGRGKHKIEDGGWSIRLCEGGLVDGKLSKKRWRCPSIPSILSSQTSKQEDQPYHARYGPYYSKAILKGGLIGRVT